jgi:lipoyl(octanoyl) transferase
VRKGAPGVYVEDKKIAALGLRIRRGCSLHGLSLNIDMDLTPFAYINPCGYPGLPTTQLRELVAPGRTDLFAETRKRLIEDLQTRLL